MKSLLDGHEHENFYAFVLFHRWLGRILDFELWKILSIQILMGYFVQY